MGRLARQPRVTRSWCATSKRAFRGGISADRQPLALAVSTVPPDGCHGAPHGPTWFDSSANSLFGTSTWKTRGPLVSVLPQKKKKKPRRAIALVQNLRFIKGGGGGVKKSRAKPSAFVIGVRCSAASPGRGRRKRRVVCIARMSPRSEMQHCSHSQSCATNTYPKQNQNPLTEVGNSPCRSPLPQAKRAGTILTP
jgi:hypothetical protein